MQKHYLYLETLLILCLLLCSHPPLFYLAYFQNASSPLLSFLREMGCRLPKLKKAEEKRSPGNIYSTLRRPQVETKVGVAYTYHFLDFLLGKEGMKYEVPCTGSHLCLTEITLLSTSYGTDPCLCAVFPFLLWSLACKNLVRHHVI